mgnify:CR=1 FL=1
MLKQLLSILILFLSISAFSQEVEQCGQTAYMEYLESINPGLKQNMDATFIQALAQSKIKTKTSQDTIHTIQVVFHIVYNTAQHNLSDDLITTKIFPKETSKIIIEFNLITIITNEEISSL